MKEQVMEIPKVVEILDDMTTKYPTNSYPHRKNIHERYAGEICQLIQQAKAEVAREIRFQILEWFRNYAHQLDRKFPHPTTEEQGWLGNIWDMIHMAGKEDFEDKWLKGDNENQTS